MASRLAGALLVAPTLICYEMTNIFISKSRRLSDRQDELYRGFLAFLATDIKFETVDHVAVAEIAAASRLSAYDASYLWLARKHGAELVTLDKDLARAFGN